MRRALASVAVLFLAGSLGPGPAHATAELKLRDGRVLVGTDLELKDGIYVLVTKEGMVTVPAQLVREMRLTGTDLPGPSGLKVTKGGPVPGTPEPPPRPTRAEQLAAFDQPPARFPRPPVDPIWRPADAFRGRDATGFRPSRWPTSPIDPVWTPRSAWKAVDDVTEFSPARWYRPPTSNAWRPRDGFAPTRWFPPVLAPEDRGAE